MQELIHKLIPLVLILDKIGRQTAHMPTEAAIDLGYADGAHDAYTEIENLIDGYANTSEQQAKALESLRAFANDINKNYLWSIGINEAYKLFHRHGLVDDNGNPTPLLTGEDGLLRSQCGKAFSYYTNYCPNCGGKVENGVYRNNKTGDSYRIVGRAIDCTNDRDGTKVIMYVKHGTIEPVYAREYSEFEQKFTLIPAVVDFEPYSKEHSAWLRTLKAGDPICILQPWFDGVEKGGRRVPDFVEKIGQLVGGAVTIHTKNFGTFYLDGGAAFNKIIMPPK